MSVAAIETTDGRRLAYQEVGDPAGVSVMVLHGTPGSRLSGVHPDPARVSAAGLRLISYDRPGYGRSSRDPGRAVVDCVADVAAIAGELRIDRFAVYGRSGGGPHALAVGARVPARVTRVGCEVGVAPFDAPDLNWLAGMDPVNTREIGWALEGETVLARELQREADKALARLDEDPAALLAEIELSPADREVVEDPDARLAWQTTTREMFAQGVWGWVDDDLELLKPWGFDLGELRVPVEVRYGRTDVLVPASHGDWLATRIPHAEVTIDERAGHLSTPDQQLDKLRALASAGS